MIAGPHIANWPCYGPNRDQCQSGSCLTEGKLSQRSTEKTSHGGAGDV